MKLTQLDISPLDSIWGVDNLGLIYVFYENGIKLKQVGGSLKHVSAGGSGVWGVNQKDKVYYRGGITLDNLAGTSWTEVPGKNCILLVKLQLFKIALAYRLL